MAAKHQPLVLIIADGWGVAPDGPGNAVARAATPVMNRLADRYPHTTLEASGLAVGLPAGQMGNSEVGHLNIGAGRIVYQDLTRISKAIEEGRFAANPVLRQAMTGVLANGGTLHLMGLFSDGGVHSHLDHLRALLAMAAGLGLSRVCIHAFLDGRDTPPSSAGEYLRHFQQYLDETGVGRLATITGRFYAMDRDQRWERVALAYRALVAGEGRTANSPAAAIDMAYAAGETDEFVLPTVILDDQGRPCLVSDGDAIIFFNFRADRAREITRAFTEPGFDAFDRQRWPRLSSYVCFTEYDATFDLPVAFPPEELHQVLAEVVAAAGWRQLHIAETEKYAHVTFFFNGGREEPFPGEDRCLVPSPREVKTYDLKPEMSADQVAAETVRRLAGGQYQVVILNFANGDMVGHTGNFAAAVKACETVDRCLGLVVDQVLSQGGVDDGRPMTAHTCNPVPFILVGEAFRGRQLRRDGILADIAPTICQVLELPLPAEMTGRSLLLPA
ncbi:MAG: 2,3-bisphosphoglycerate-independent phosphoglycerate mutase [Deltaproteobacteria bacterium]|nr:2,3-bisphosphoglycerate-independent phosphoglycerate mutase [Deltaproteobacteria bacterium]